MSLAYGNNAGDVGTIDFSTGKQQLKHLAGHTGSVLSLAYTSCGKLLVSGGSDCEGKVYSPTSV